MIEFAMAMISLAGLFWILRNTCTDQRKRHVMRTDRRDRHGWETATVDAGHHIHLLPLGDGQTHLEDPDGGCPCGPDVTRVTRSNGADGWLLIHHRSRLEQRR